MRKKCSLDLRIFQLYPDVFDLQRTKEKMPPKFYVVQKAGVPAVWQSDPQRMPRLLKHKTGFTVVSDLPSDTRADALIKLRQLFPGFRATKSA